MRQGRSPQLFLGFFALCDINEVQDHAIDPVLPRAIGNDAHEEILAALVAHLAFDWNQIVEDALGVLRQAGIVDLAGEIRERPADVAREDVEQFLDSRGESLDPQLAIQKNRADIGRSDEILQVAV